MVVRRPVVSNRVMRRMPLSPAVSFVQFSSLPVPSEVTMPMPVTTTMGRPALSRVAMPRIPVPSPPFDESHTLATPVSDAGDRHLRHQLARRPGIARSRGLEQLSAPQDLGGDRQVGGELRFEALPDVRAGRTNGQSAGRQERLLFARGRLGAGRARQHRGPPPPPRPRHPPPPPLPP